MKLIKLLPLALMAGQTVGYYLYRAHRGWQVDFKGLPRVEVRHRGHAITLAEGSRRLATAGSVLVGFRLSEPWTFALARQGWLRLDAELVTGIREVDERLHIGIESRRLADALIEDAELRMHLLQLDALFARHDAKFQRLEANGRDLAVLVAFRRAGDRIQLWHALIDWLVVLDAALVAVSRRRLPRRR